MRRIQSTSLLGALLVLALPIACSQEPQQPAEQSQEAAEVAPAVEASAEAPAAEQGGKGKRPRRAGPGAGPGGGPSAALLHAASELELTEAQRTKIAALQQLRPESKPELDHKAFQVALAEGVKAGRVDEKLIQEQLDKGKQAAEAFRTTQLKQLNELHAVLDPTQRALLVKEAKAGLEEQKAQREAMLKRLRPGLLKSGKEADGPEGAAKDGAEEGKGRPGPRGMRGLRGGRGGGDPLGALTRGLDLTEEQQEKINAIVAKLPKPAEAEEGAEGPIDRQQVLLDAFVKDDFDATKLDLSHSMQRPESYLSHINEVLAVLDAGQRERLAERLTRGNDRAQGFSRGGKFMGKKGLMKGAIKAPPGGGQDDGE